MVTIDDLIQDEKEAIAGYQAFLDQGVLRKSMIPKIKKIIAEEKKHIRILRKMK